MLTERPAYRQCTTYAHQTPPVEYNGNFKVLKGAEFFKEGLISFPKEDQLRLPHEGVDGFYKTVFGWSVANVGIINGNCNENMQGALKDRLMAARGSRELDAIYRAAQTSFISTHTKFISFLKEHILAHMKPYSTMLEECEEHHDDPHKKKAMRIQSYTDLTNGDRQGTTVADRLWTSRAVCFLKTQEVAKPGKAQRTVVDLSVAGSLQGFVLAKVMKYALSELLEIPGPTGQPYGQILFCLKPEPSLLTKIFEKLIDPPDTAFAVLFSDDACYSCRRPDGTVFKCNLDLTKCDLSHTEALFNTLIEITPEHARDDMRRLVEQCLVPLYIYDLTDRTRKVVLKPKKPVLYSGVTITTLINNIAVYLLCYSLFISKASTPRAVIEAAAQVGYIITIDDCTDDFHKLQFLKHSPCFDNKGDLCAVLNLGVLARSSGRVKGDLPGKRKDPLELRAKRFQNALLNGMYPRTHFELKTRMLQSTVKADARSTEVVRQMFEYKVDSSGREHHTISNAELYARYDLTPQEQDEVTDLLGSCGFEQSVACSGLSKILKADYGLVCQYYEDSE